MNKYCPPIKQAVYKRWLQRRAQSLVRRDRLKGNKNAQYQEYKTEIYAAVCRCQGVDAYTDEPLDWTLLSQYNNTDSQKQGRVYKKKFALLPTIDHVDDGMGKPNFEICAWRTNDAKNDLSLNELIDFCKKIIKNNT